MMAVDAAEGGVVVELQVVATMGTVVMTADMSEAVGGAMGPGVTGMVASTEAVGRQGWVEGSAGQEAEARVVKDRLVVGVEAAVLPWAIQAVEEAVERTVAAAREVVEEVAAVKVAG